jgi:hypothetical protein
MGLGGFFLGAGGPVATPAGEGSLFHSAHGRASNPHFRGISNIEENTFKIKHEGKKLHLRVTEGSVDRLDAIANMVFAAISPAADATFAQ